MTGLKAEFMRFVPSPDGPQAELFLIEPDGKELQVRCLCRKDGKIDVGVIGDKLEFERILGFYSPAVVFSIAKHVTLSGPCQ